MDRAYAEPLDVRTVAAVAHISEAHFIRSFRTVFGETPHRYLQRRRHRFHALTPPLLTLPGCQHFPVTVGSANDGPSNAAPCVIATRAV